MDRLATILAEILTDIRQGIRNVNASSLSEVVRQWLLVAFATGLIVVEDADTRLLIISATSATLGMWTRGATVAEGRVEQKVDEKVAHREMIGTTGSGTGMATPIKNGNGKHGPGSAPPS